MSLEIIGDLFGLNAGKDTIEAARKNRRVINRFDKKARGYVDQGVNRASGFLDQAGDIWNPLSGGLGLYADAIGMRGAEGSQRAVDAFQTGPGFDFALNQGLDALDRRASARGSFQSGGNQIDTINYATGVANQEYGNWLDRLGGASMAGAQGQSGVLGSLANLYTGAADQKVGIAGDVFSGRMAANNQIAQGGEANRAGIANLGGTLMDIGSMAFGYGGF